MWYDTRENLMIILQVNQKGSCTVKKMHHNNSKKKRDEARERFEKKNPKPPRCFAIRCYFCGNNSFCWFSKDGRRFVKCLLDAGLSAAVYLSRLTFCITTFCVTPRDHEQSDEETNGLKQQNEIHKYLRWCHAYQSASDKRVWQLSRYFQYKQAVGQSLSIRPMMPAVRRRRG